VDLIDDPQRVRDALGVTPLDVDDTLVASLMFGPTAEAHIKAEVGSWATIIDKNDAAYSQDQDVRLRAAAVYFCAALLARRLEMGGAIGLVSGGRQGASVNWSERYKDMMLAYRLMLGELESPDPDAAMGAALTPMFTMKFGSPRRTWITLPPIAEIGPVIEED